MSRNRDPERARATRTTRASLKALLHGLTSTHSGSSSGPKTGRSAALMVPVMAAARPSTPPGEQLPSARRLGAVRAVAHPAMALALAPARLLLLPHLC